jgi:hypothetical protein
MPFPVWLVCVSRLIDRPKLLRTYEELKFYYQLIFRRGIPVSGRRFRPARSKWAKNSPNENNSRNPGSLTKKDLYRDRQLFVKFMYENVIKKKNKPDPALVQTSYLSNEIEKRIPKSCETIPLIVITSLTLSLILYLIANTSLTLITCTVFISHHLSLILYLACVAFIII